GGVVTKALKNLNSTSSRAKREWNFRAIARKAAAMWPVATERGPALRTPAPFNYGLEVMHMHNTNGNGSAIAALRVRVLSGRGIAHRHPDKRRRAVLAAQLADGYAIVQLSIGQLAGLLGVSRTYIDRARKLTPETRREILSGRNISFRA